VNRSSDGTGEQEGKEPAEIISCVDCTSLDQTTKGRGIKKVLKGTTDRRGLYVCERVPDQNHKIMLFSIFETV
jgi:hypothetical protein